MSTRRLKASTGGAGLFGHIVLQRVVEQSGETRAKKRAKCATYMYVVQMIVVTALLFAYYFTRKELRIVEIQGDEDAEGKRLVVPRDAWFDIHEKNPTCPCGNTNIPFGEFAEVSYTMHEVCRDADVISQTCFAQQTELACNGMPFEFAFPIFTGIRKLCNSSKLAIDTAALDLIGTSVVTPTLVDVRAFEEQAASAKERTRRAAIMSILSPLNVASALNVIERPVTAVTVGATEQEPPRSPPLPARPVVQGTDGWAFIWGDSTLPGSDLKCNCYNSFECSRPIEGAEWDGAEQKCSLMATMSTVPIDRLLTNLNGEGEPARRRRAQTTKEDDEDTGDVKLDGSVQDQFDATREAEEASTSLGDILKTTTEGDYCCSASSEIICRAEQACFLTSLCCSEARDSVGISASSTKLEALVGYQEYEATPITSGPFQQVVTSGFIQTFDLLADYDTYYDACAPTSCAYAEMQNLQAYEVLVTVLGLIGGISVGFKACLTVFVEVLPDKCFSGDDAAKRNAVGIDKDQEVEMATASSPVVPIGADGQG